MLETRTIIDRVQQHDYPSDWLVYCGHGRWGKAILSIIGYWFGLFAGTSILLTIVLVVLASSTSELTNNIFATFLSSSILFLLVVGMTSIAVYTLRKARRAANTLLVILPDGVFLYSKGRPEKISTFAFGDIVHIDLGMRTAVYRSGGRYGFPRITYWLDLYMCDGHYLKWPLDDALGELDVVGKSIIAAHLRYWRGNP